MGNTYKKKEKAKPTKVTKEELNTIQQYVDAINKAQMQIGAFEFQKAAEVVKIQTLQNKMNEYQTTLQKKYGTVSVNIVDGSLKNIEDESVNKKD